MNTRKRIHSHTHQYPTRQPSAYSVLVRAVGCRSKGPWFEPQIGHTFFQNFWTKNSMCLVKQALLKYFHLRKNCGLSIKLTYHQSPPLFGQTRPSRGRWLKANVLPLVTKRKIVPKNNVSFCTAGWWTVLLPPPKSGSTRALAISANDRLPTFAFPKVGWWSPIGFGYSSSQHHDQSSIQQSIPSVAGAAHPRVSTSQHAHFRCFLSSPLS